MKRNIFSIFLLLLFTITCFSGCGNSNGDTTPKITFYSGDAVYYSLETEGNKILQLPTNPSKPGFSFEGWFYDKDSWLRPFTKYDYEKKALTESVNVYAKFRQSRLNYNINFYNGENLHATIRTQGYEVLTLPQNPERINHIFDGWFFDDGTFLKPLTENTYASKKLGQDVNVYAKFLHNDGTVYKITFMVEDEVYHTINTAGNKTLTNMPLSPNKTDYLFMGWFYDKDVWKNKFDATTYSDKYLTQDITVYAYFALPTEQKYTITFMVDEQEYHSIETAGHEELTLPENPEKSGYEFGGWFFDNTTFATEFDSTYYEKTTLTENVSVYAKFTKIEQSETDSGTKTISFEVDGEVYHTIATAGNETLTMPAEPYNDELTFAGWYFDNNTFLQPFTENAYSTTYLTSNVTIYAKFTPDVYQSNLEFVLSEDETYYIVVGLGECANAKNILVPDTYNGLPVKEIVGVTYDEHFVKVYDGVFSDLDTLVKLKISANVEVIGKWAVSGADKLVKVEFAENSKLHTLGDMCFNHSISLKSIVLPKGVTSLPQYAFTQCESLTSFTFEDPTTFTEFGPYALYGTAITELDVPKNTTKIGEHCFSDCASLARISLPKALKTIDTGAFNDCRKLKYVELEDTDAWCGVDIADPWGVPFIWAGGFYQNGERVKNLVISEGVKEIKQFVFADCKTLEEVTIPSTVELMESCSFADVLRLRVLNYNAKNCKLNFHSSSSHYYVFEHCGAYSLTSHAPGYVYPEGAKHIIVNIGASVELLPANLFNYTAGGYQPLVKTINFLGTTPPEFGTNWIKAVSLLENVTVPAGTESTYLTALGSYYEKFLLTE